MKKFIYDGSNGATAQKVLDQLQNFKDSFIRESYLINTSYTETNIDEIEDNTEESEGGEDQELGVTDVRVVDTNIKVMITGMGANKK
ncbi:MAG: hypothetical protein PUK48_05135, partial [Spirochaetales bacterium]|nr:hypothetical protein [Spirochaetales bacterium]